jgi:hypothetical protein
VNKLKACNFAHKTGYLLKWGIIIFWRSSILLTTYSAVWFFILIVILPQPNNIIILSNTCLESKSVVIVNLGLNKSNIFIFYLYSFLL